MTMTLQNMTVSWASGHLTSRSNAVRKNSMDLICNTVWSTSKPFKSNLCGKVVTAWSCRNLIAFSTGYRKLNVTEERAQTASSRITNGIHILLPDSPWDVCSLSSGHLELIQNLTWDGSGSRLLSSDLSGVCKLWAMKNHMVNDWECVCTVDMAEGERLVAVSWIDTGIKNLFSLSDEVHSVIPKRLGERFKTNRSKPPYVEMGGMRSKDGWVAVSESGLMCVATIKPEVYIVRKCLDQVRARVAVADLAFSSKGKVIVGASDGNPSSAVQFYRVSLNGGADGCQISSDPLPCLFPHSHSEMDKFAEYRVTNIQFVSKNSGEALLVGTTGPSGSCIKRWEMKKETIQVHPKFQQDITHMPLHNYSVYKWTIINTCVDSAKVVCLCLPRLPSPKIDISPSLLTYPASLLLVQYDDDRVELLNSVSLVSSGTFYTRSNAGDSEMGSASKKARTSGPSSGSSSIDSLGAITYSPCCCCAVGLTMAGDVCLFKLQHPKDNVGGGRLKRSLTDLLQYCLLTGWECWDVIMAGHLGTPPDTLEAVLRQFTDEFSMQDMSQQQIYVSRFRAIKASICRCMKDGGGQAVDCHIRQLLMAVATAFRSLYWSHSASEQLSKIQVTMDAEIDKVVQTLDTSDFTIESTTLLSIYPLIQWLTDLTVFLVIVFTSHQGKDSAPGVSLVRDSNTLCTLRELLVLIRIWGQTTPVALPSVTPTADKNESLALLFKIFTRIWVLSKQASSEEPDIHVEERLAAEAAPLIPNPVFLQNMQMPNLNRGVCGKAVSGAIKPNIYQFGTQPFMHSTHQSFHPFASTILPLTSNGSPNIDVVRRIYFDASPDTRVKQCTRCNCLSLMDCVGDHAVAKAWEQRWVRSCVCGGNWRKFTFSRHQAATGQ